MDLIEREIDLDDPKLIANLTVKLEQREYADAHQLWVVARLAAKQRRAGRGGMDTHRGA